MSEKMKNEIIKLGVYGEEGSFSHAAGLQYAQENTLKVEILYLVEMDNLFDALTKKEIDMAILPVINQNGGIVRPAFEAMGRYNFKIVSGFKLAVVQCLITLPGLQGKEITQITSHPQAHRQCAEYLEREFPNVELMEWNDTASAARDLAAGNISKTSAVLASSTAAEIYKLKVMQKGVEDNPENVTTFVVLKPL